MTFFPCKSVKMLPKSTCFFPVMSSLSANTHRTLDSKWQSFILTIWRNCPPHLPGQQRRRQWHGSCAVLWSDPPGIPSCPAGIPSCGRPSSPSCRPPGSTAASLLSVSRFSHLLWGRCGGPCNTRRLGRKVGWCWRWWWWSWQLILSMHSWRAQIHTVWKCQALPGYSFSSNPLGQPMYPSPFTKTAIANSTTTTSVTKISTTTMRHSHLPRPLLPSPGAAAAIVARTLAPQSSHDSLEDINILI